MKIEFENSLRRLTFLYHLLDTKIAWICSNFISLNFLEILNITTNSFLRCHLSYFALANIWLCRYDSFFRFIALRWHKCQLRFNYSKQLQTSFKVSSNFIIAMNQLYCLNVIVLATPKNMTIQNGIFSEKKVSIF